MVGVGVERPAALPTAGPTHAGAAKPFNSVLRVLSHRARDVNLGFNFIHFLQLTAGRACPDLPPDATGREAGWDAPSPRRAAGPALTLMGTG